MGGSVGSVRITALGRGEKEAGGITGKAQGVVAK